MSQRIEVPRVGASVEARDLVRARAIRRTRALGAALMFGLAVLAVRGAQLAIHPSERTLEEAAAQRWGKVVVNGRRGDVVDRRGRRLATSVVTPNVVADPLSLPEEDVPEIAARLSEILGIDRAVIERKLWREGKYVRLATKVHPAVARQIEELGVRGVWVEGVLGRYYPERELASQVLGYVDVNGHGVDGLERYWEDRLRGGQVVLQRRRDRLGLDVTRPAAVDAGAYEGLTVHTTLDNHVQRLAERALAGVMERHEPAAAWAVVVDVRTGDLLAMANAPTFNPNKLGDDPRPRRNHILEDEIEPGSVFKPFTVAAALQLGVIEADADVDCEGGSWAGAGMRIRDDHPHGVISLSEVIKYSSNIGSAKLALMMGPERFLGMLNEFGFGERSGVALPDERKGKLRAADRIKRIELATTAYGQGVTSTPLQLAMATATIANDGKRMEPRIVSRVEDGSGVVHLVTEPTVARRVVSAEVARQVTDMMVTVTEKGGTGTRARVPGYLVAGKTGTAEKVENGRYSSKRLGSFMGFLPADDPVLAIVVSVDEPSVGSKYGGIVAAPAFAEIAEGALRYLGIPPNPALLGEEVLAVAPPMDVDPVEPITLQWASTGWSVPDLSGRTLREVVAGLQSTGLSVEVRGSGRVVEQHPSPGQQAAPGERLAVVLR